MGNKFVDYFSRISPLSKEEAEAITESMQTKTYKKGEYLLREGQFSVKTYFILEGCVREYILTEGEEKTTNFITEEQWAISLNSFTPNKAATHNWICVEDTTVVVGDEEQGQALLARYGFEQYEISAYGKAERECQHNLNYWQFGDYLGIGAGAHSKITV